MYWGQRCSEQLQHERRLTVRKTAALEGKPTVLCHGCDCILDHFVQPLWLWRSDLVLEMGGRLAGAVNAIRQRQLFRSWLWKLHARQHVGRQGASPAGKARQAA